MSAAHATLLLPVPWQRIRRARRRARANRAAHLAELVGKHGRRQTARERRALVRRSRQLWWWR